MNSDSLFARIAAIAAIISAPLALGASTILGLAIDFDSEIIDNPANMLLLDPPIDRTFRSVEFVGVFGYYLLLIPAALYLWAWLKPRSHHFSNIFATFGLGYIFVGALGSALLWSVLPPIMNAYPQAADTEQEVLAIVFASAFDLVVYGLFPLSNIFGGMWWIGSGALLRTEQRFLGIFMIILGIGNLGFAVGDALRIELLSALEFFTFLAPIWALWLGVVILRGTGQDDFSRSGAEQN